jgi:hypothetical protein
MSNLVDTEIAEQTRRFAHDADFSSRIRSSLHSDTFAIATRQNTTVPAIVAQCAFHEAENHRDTTRTC